MEPAQLHTERRLGEPSQYKPSMNLADPPYSKGTPCPVPLWIGDNFSADSVFLIVPLSYVGLSDHRNRHLRAPVRHRRSSAQGQRDHMPSHDTIFLIWMFQGYPSPYRARLGAAGPIGRPILRGGNVAAVQALDRTSPRDGGTSDEDQISAGVQAVGGGHRSWVSSMPTGRA